MEKMSSFAQLYLRLAIGAAYLVFGLDRLGVWGKYGDKNVSWGDWEHFDKYAAEVMSFLPLPVVNVLAIVATICELSFGVMLLIGLWTRVAALGSGVLALLFAISMAVSFGIVSPLSYSVFTVSAASFLLASSDDFKWSVENLIMKREVLS
jgi:putative oxidoreductase